jgi:uncharacterized membrane protein
VTFDELRTSPKQLPEGYFHLAGQLGVGDEGRSPVEWTTLARHGVTVRGPKPAEIGVHADPEELREWVRGNANTYWRQQFMAYPDDLLVDAGLAWGVLGISRLHYSLVTGDVTSKTGAGHHAIEAFPEHRPIIEEALRHRSTPPARPEHPDRPRQAAAVSFMDAAGFLDLGMVGHIALVLATIATGLAAGLFYAFSCAVMPALRRSDDATRVPAMRRINQSIQNGWFALSFAGAPVLTALAAILDLSAGNWARVAGEALGLVLFGVTLMITVQVNIPLNLALDRADPADPAAAWRAFEPRWVRWNNVRTLSTTGSLAVLVLTLALS